MKDEVKDIDGESQGHQVLTRLLSKRPLTLVEPAISSFNLIFTALRHQHRILHQDKTALILIAEYTDVNTSGVTMLGSVRGCLAVNSSLKFAIDEAY